MQNFYYHHRTARDRMASNTSTVRVSTTERHFQNSDGLRSNKARGDESRWLGLGWRRANTNSESSSSRLAGPGCTALLKAPSIQAGSSRLSSTADRYLSLR